jgi:hypothetical protein
MVFLKTITSFDHPFMDVIEDIVNIAYSPYSFRLDYKNAAGHQIRSTFTKGMDPEMHNIRINDDTFSPTEMVNNPEKMAALIRQDLTNSAIEALP